MSDVSGIVYMLERMNENLAEIRFVFKDIMQVFLQVEPVCPRCGTACTNTACVAAEQMQQFGTLHMQEADMAAKKKSSRQVRFLLSKGSPLSAKKRGKLKRELHSGKVRVTKSRRK